LSARLGDCQVEFDFIDQRLERPNPDCRHGPLNQRFRLLGEDIEPLLLVATEFLQREFASSRVLIVVGVYFRVTVKAHGNRVRYVVAAVGDHVVGLDLDPAKPAADAAATAATCQKVGNLCAIKTHSYQK
jgi:hypothetical protein